MTVLRISLLALALLGALPALAQNASPATARGTIETISADGAELGVKARDGQPVTVRLKPDTTVTLVVPASLSDVKPGAYVGVAALPGDDGGLKAMEVHVFPRGDARRRRGVSPVRSRARQQYDQWRVVRAG